MKRAVWIAILCLMPLAGHAVDAMIIAAIIPMTGEAVQSSDAVMLLADAIRRTGSPEPAGIRSALAATRNFTGVTGDITFDKTRNPIGRQAVILTFAKGTVQYVKTIKPSGF